MKQCSNRSELLRRVQETGFACVDMNLYLDNHPEDKNAINVYNSLVNDFAQARCAYVILLYFYKIKRLQITYL